MYGRHGWEGKQRSTVYFTVFVSYHGSCRRNDKAVQLRIKWIESAANIFESHYFAIATLNGKIYTQCTICRIFMFLIEYLKARLLDPEEKVRAAVCRVIGEMNLDHVIDHVDMKLLQEIAERCKDKKVTLDSRTAYIY